MSRPSKTPLPQSLDDESEFERGSDSFAGDANQDAARRLEDTDRDSMKHIRPRDLIKSAQHNSLHSLRSVDISDPARPISHYSRRDPPKERRPSPIRSPPPGTQSNPYSSYPRNDARPETQRFGRSQRDSANDGKSQPRQPPAIGRSKSSTSLNTESIQHSLFVSKDKFDRLTRRYEKLQVEHDNLTSLCDQMLVETDAIKENAKSLTAERDAALEARDKVLEERITPAQRPSKDPRVVELLDELKLEREASALVEAKNSDLVLQLEDSKEAMEKYKAKAIESQKGLKQESQSLREDAENGRETSDKVAGLKATLKFKCQEYGRQTDALELQVQQLQQQLRGDDPTGIREALVQTQKRVSELEYEVEIHKGFVRDTAEYALGTTRKEHQEKTRLDNMGYKPAISITDHSVKNIESMSALQQAAEHTKILEQMSKSKDPIEQLIGKEFKKGTYRAADNRVKQLWKSQHPVDPDQEKGKYYLTPDKVDYVRVHMAADGMTPVDPDAIHHELTKGIVYGYGDQVKYKNGAYNPKYNSNYAEGWLLEMTAVLQDAGKIPEARRRDCLMRMLAMVTEATQAPWKEMQADGKARYKTWGCDREAAQKKYAPGKFK